jgi:hypothetical protein
LAKGENADAAIANLPVRSHDDYFDHRDGRWLNRTEYCEWRIKIPVPRRYLSEFQKKYEKECAGL